MTSSVTSSSKRTRQQSPQPSQRLSHSATVICSRVFLRQKGSPVIAGCRRCGPETEARTCVAGRTPMVSASMRAPILGPEGRPPRRRPAMLFDGVDLGLEPRGRAPAWSAATGRASRPCCKVLGRPDRGRRRRALHHSPARASPSSRRSRRSAGETTVLDYAPAGGAEPHEAEAALEAFGLDPGKRGRGACRAARRAARPWPRRFAEEPDVILLGRADQPPRHPGHRDAGGRSWPPAAPPP